MKTSTYVDIVYTNMYVFRDNQTVNVNYVRFDWLPINPSRSKLSSGEFALRFRIKSPLPRDWSWSRSIHA